MSCICIQLYFLVNTVNVRQHEQFLVGKFTGFVNTQEGVNFANKRLDVVLFENFLLYPPTVMAGPA